MTLKEWKEVKLTQYDKQQNNIIVYEKRDDTKYGEIKMYIEIRKIDNNTFYVITPTTDYYFNNKEQAIKYAKNYMKSH